MDAPSCLLVPTGSGHDCRLSSKSPLGVFVLPLVCSRLYPVPCFPGETSPAGSVKTCVRSRGGQMEQDYTRGPRTSLLFDHYGFLLRNILHLHVLTFQSPPFHRTVF